MTNMFYDVVDRKCMKIKTQWAQACRTCAPGPKPGPAALHVEKQLTALRLPAGWLKVLSETKLYSGQIKITF